MVFRYADGVLNPHPHGPLSPFGHVISGASAATEAPQFSPHQEADSSGWIGGCANPAL